MNMEPKMEGSSGPIIGVIVILALVILGGLYFWGERRDSTPAPAPTTQGVGDIRAQSGSDGVSAIEADLEATAIESVDSELYSP